MKIQLFPDKKTLALVLLTCLWCMSPETSAVGQVPPPVPIVATPGSTTSPGPELLGSSATLAWYWSMGATYYAYRFAEVESGPGEPVSIGNISSVTVLLNPGRRYVWSVAAGNAWGLSGYSAPRYFQTPSNYVIVVSVSPPGSGSVSGGGTFPSGTGIGVAATANSGYAFVEWTEGERAVSTSPTYLFSVTSNRTLTGHFLAGPVGGPGELTGMHVSSGRFRCFLNGIPGSNYVMQISSNLGSWNVLGTNRVESGGMTLIVDPLETNITRRFYRAVH